MTEIHCFMIHMIPGHLV